MSPSPHRLSRAEFLRSAARSVLFVALGAIGYRYWTDFTGKITRRTKAKLPSGTPHSPWYSMAIDIDACIGCGRCVDACSLENDVPEGHYRTWIERYVVRNDGSVEIASYDPAVGYPEVDDKDVAKAFFVPKLCNHCEESPCTQVCPVGATFITDDGVVLLDKDWCIGCRYCVQACPYGSRFWNPVSRTADKCTLCYHRIKQGQQPACVEVCPTGARIFGDISDPESRITKFAKLNPVMTIKPHLKTGAKVLYKGLTKEVV